MLKHCIKKWRNNHIDIAKRIAYFLLPKDQICVNADLCNPNQKRLLICYITLTGINLNEIRHAQMHHLNQIIHTFVQLDYRIDLCRLDDLGAYERLCNNHYDVIFGCGPVFKKFCKSHKEALKICFIMENNPEVVEQKYQERINYFKQRHPNVDCSCAIDRMKYFDKEQFQMANACLLMNSSYNAMTFKKYCKNLQLICSNAITNANYIFNEDIVLEQIKNNHKRILWFGSTGLIHKGLDIVIDAMADMSDYTLECYGIFKEEKPLFNKLKKSNTFDCGRVNVNSNDFIKKICNRFNFMVFPSCSEGMSTAVATCMAHGIIPIITKECGFEPTDCIIEIQDVSVETITDTIRKVSSWDDKTILSLKKKCMLYAKQNLSLAAFDARFKTLIESLLSDNGCC